MYDNNPTLPEIGINKPLEEIRQGEALGLEAMENSKSGKKFYIESYGCAMNFSDSEIVASILFTEGLSLIHI